MSKAGRIIVNVSHLDHLIYEGAMGRWKVEGRGEPGNEKRRYGVLEIPETLHYAEDKGWGDPGPNSPFGRTIIPVDGAKFANEIVEQYARSYGDSPQRRINLGVFIAAGDVPTAAELEAAEEAYRKTLEIFFDEGNASWSRTRNVRSISDISKLAAKVLGITVEWAASAGRIRKITCPACGDLVNPNIAVHRRSENGEPCNYVLDPEKAKNILDFQPQPAEKPRKEVAAR